MRGVGRNQNLSQAQQFIRLLRMGCARYSSMGGCEMAIRQGGPSTEPSSTGCSDFGAQLAIYWPRRLMLRHRAD
jgi:hypothetical protein